MELFTLIYPNIRLMSYPLSLWKIPIPTTQTGGCQMTPIPRSHSDLLHSCNPQVHFLIEIDWFMCIYLCTKRKNPFLSPTHFDSNSLWSLCLLFGGQMLCNRDTTHSCNKMRLVPPSSIVFLSIKLQK